MPRRCSSANGALWCSWAHLAPEACSLRERSPAGLTWLFLALQASQPLQPRVAGSAGAAGRRFPAASNDGRSGERMESDMARCPNICSF